jgi:hypothetical protein
MTLLTELYHGEILAAPFLDGSLFMFTRHSAAGAQP